MRSLCGFTLANIQKSSRLETYLTLPSAKRYYGHACAMAGQDAVPQRRQSLLPRRAASTATRRLAERTSMYAKGADIAKTLDPMQESAATALPVISSTRTLVKEPEASPKDVVQTGITSRNSSNEIASQKSLEPPQRTTSLRKPSTLARTASTSRRTNATKPVTVAPTSGLRSHTEPIMDTSMASNTKAASRITIMTRSASRKDLSLQISSAVKSGDSVEKPDPKSRLPSYTPASDHAIQPRLAIKVSTDGGNHPKMRSDMAKVGNSKLLSHRKSASVAANLGKGSVTLPRRASTAQFIERKPSKVHRPSFSTMQQHFTPQEESKRITRSRASSVSGPQAADLHISDQDSAHQVELLQLHLLHRSVHMVQSQWLQSAEDKLRRRFEDLVPKHTKLRSAYNERQTRRNALALAAWISDSTGGPLAEKIRTLSWIIMEVDGFLDPAGQYMRVITTFEEWFHWAFEVFESRSMMQNSELRIIEGLGNPWRSDVANLEALLASYSTRLKSLGPAHEESCLARVLSLIESALASMLEEMDNVRSIESDMMFRESDWLRDAVNALV